MTYFNTTSVEGKQLKEYIGKASRQGDIVKAIFKVRGPILTPSQVLSYFPDPKPPLTSIRRCMTVLTADNVLEKMPQQKEGIYGRPEHYWKAL